MKFLDLLNSVSTSIQVLHIGNAVEFVKNNVSVFYIGNEIIHQTSCCHTFQQNGVTERNINILIWNAQRWLICVFPRTYGLSQYTGILANIQVLRLKQYGKAIFSVLILGWYLVIYRSCGNISPTKMLKILATLTYYWLFSFFWDLYLLNQTFEYPNPFV